MLLDYPQDSITPKNYMDAFFTYAKSQHADGKPFIGEYQDEVTGEWINREGGRSRYYNHSTFADLLITGLIGLRPSDDPVLNLSPLLSEDTWEWFCLDVVRYHEHNVTIPWDQTGHRFGRGTGLQIWVDGGKVAQSDRMQTLSVQLPPPKD